MTSNYKEELREILRDFKHGLSAKDGTKPKPEGHYRKFTEDDALAAIDRLNDEVIGEDESFLLPLGDANKLGFLRAQQEVATRKVRSQLRSELRQAFGINHLGADTQEVSSDKEGEK